MSHVPGAPLHPHHQDVYTGVREGKRRDEEEGKGWDGVEEAGGIHSSTKALLSMCSGPITLGGGTTHYILAASHVTNPPCSGQINIPVQSSVDRKGLFVNSKVRQLK